MKKFSCFKIIKIFHERFFFSNFSRPMLVLKSDQGFVGYKSGSSCKLECNKASYEAIQVERGPLGLVYFKGKNDLKCRNRWRSSHSSSRNRPKRSLLADRLWWHHGRRRHPRRFLFGTARTLQVVHQKWRRCLLNGRQERCFHSRDSRFGNGHSLGILTRTSLNVSISSLSEFLFNFFSFCCFYLSWIFSCFNRRFRPFFFLLLQIYPWKP